MWKKIEDHLGSYLGWFWESLGVGDHFGSCTNLTAQSTASHRGNWMWNSNCKLSFLFPPCRQSSPESLLASYLELSLFQAPRCVPFSFASSPLSESLEQATLNLRQWRVAGKLLPVTVLDPFVVVGFKSLLFCNYGQTISCQKGEGLREVSQIVLARIVVAT